MPSIDRTSIIHGPAKITFGGQSFWSKGDITMRQINERFALESANFGPLDERVQNRRFEITFEPEGRFTSALAAILWPYAATNIGDDVFGASDTPLTINTKAGQQFVFHNSAITSMPSIRLGVAQTIQGSVTFTCLLANNTDPTNAAAYYTQSSVAYPGDTGFDVADILTKAYSSAWGAAPWDSFLTEEGWEFEFDLTLADKMVDGLGTVGMSLQSLVARATAIPVGPSEADSIAAMQSTAALGASIATSDDLIVQATGVYVKIANAGLQEHDLGFGSERKRLGPHTWMATRTVTTGTPDALFYVGTAAPL